MATTLAPPRMTIDEYFALEMATEYPNAYRAGEVVPIDHTRLAVGLIKTNLLLGVNPRSCLADRVLLSFRVRIPAMDAYLYPDLCAVVGEVQVESREGTGTLPNPTLLIDVLSDRPAHADPDWRAEAYQTVASVCEYVRVASDRPYVAVHRRGRSGGWVLSEEADLLDAGFSLESVGVTFPMEQVYDGAFDYMEFDEGVQPSDEAF